MPDYTKLNKGQQVAYDSWKANNKLEESEDYDMKGYWKEQGFKSPKHSGHFPDTYKVKAPFSEGDRYMQVSDESKYSGNPSYLSGTNSSFDKRGQGTWNEDKFEGYRKGTKSIKIKDMKSKSGMKMKQKAARGLQDVAVPEPGSGADVMSSAASYTAMGASVGGVYGAAAGAVYGTAVGVLDKNKKDKENQIALEKNATNKMNRQFDGLDETINQKMQAYKKGALKMKNSKVVEAEHKEHIFDSDMKHKGVVLGKTHKEGGEDIEVDEGDSIFPAKHKATIDKALKKGDIKTINKIKKKLPKDTVDGKAAFGLNGDPNNPDNLDEAAYKKRNKTLGNTTSFNGRTLYADNSNRKGQYNDYSNMVKGYDDGSSTWMAQGEKGNPYPYAVGKNSKGNMYRDDNMPKIKPIDSSKSAGIPSFTPPTTLNANAPTTSLDISKTAAPDTTDGTKGNAAGNIGKYANVANNLIQGLKDQPKVEESYLDPELLKYTDRSESLRTNSRQAETVMGANARNTSGGLVSNIRSNQQSASVDNLDRQDQINEREMGKADAVDNTNVGIKNNAKQINLTRKDMYKDIMDKNRAASQSYMDAGAKEIADQSNVNEQTSYLKSRDAKADAVDQQRLNIANQMTMYTIDANGNKVFNNNSTGGSLSPSGTTTSVTKKIDKEGKDSSSTTVKTAPIKQTSRSSSKTSVFGTTRRRTRK